MLPGRDDALTWNVVATLGEIGDPRAIAPLEMMLDHPTIEFDGVIRSYIIDSIKRCKQNRVPGGP
jgi:hypothetical protein